MWNMDWDTGNRIQDQGARTQRHEVTLTIWRGTDVRGPASGADEVMSCRRGKLGTGRCGTRRMAKLRGAKGRDRVRMGEGNKINRTKARIMITDLNSSQLFYSSW